MKIGYGVLAKLATASAAALVAAAANAEPRSYDIPNGQLKAAVEAFIAQCGCQLLYKTEDLKGLVSNGLRGNYETEAGLEKLLEGSGLKAVHDASGAIVVFALGTGNGVPGNVTFLDTVLVRGPALHLGDTARTGTRLDIDPMELPQSVTAVTNEVLAHQQAKNLRDALFNFAGVADQTGDGSYGMRGFSAGIARNGDLSAGQSFDAPMSTISRVEVIKGPDAIVAGLGAGYGGVINVISKTPESRKILETTLSVGSRGYIDMSVDANTPILADKSLMVRVVADKAMSDTTINGYEGRSKTYIGPSVTWRNRGWGSEATLSYERQSGNEAPMLYVYTNGKSLTSDLQAIFVPPDDQYAHQTAKITTVDLKQRIFEHWKIGYKFAANRQIFNSNAGTGFLGSLYGLSNNLVVSNLSVVDGQYKTQTGKLELTGEFDTGPIEHRVLIARDDINSTTDFYGYTRGIYTVDLTTGAVADVSKTLGPMLGYAKLPSNRTGSHQVTHENGMLAFDHFVWGPWAGNVGVRRIEYEPDPSTKGRKFEATLPAMGLVYRWTPTLSLYGSASKGFRTNSSRFQFGDIPVEPEDAKQAEVGFKALMADSKIALTASVFHIDQHNVSVSDPDPTHRNKCINTTCWVSVSGVRSQGGEIEVSGDFTKHLELRAGYAYVAKRISTKGTSTGILYAHNSASLWATYRFGDEFINGLWVNAGVSGRSRRNTASSTAENPGNGRIDANIGYDAKKWSVVGGVKNLANRNLYTVESGFFGQGVLQQPREYYFSSRYSFF